MRRPTTAFDGRGRGGRGRGRRASSATTTSGPWASPSARRWPPSRSSARWPRASARPAACAAGPSSARWWRGSGLVPNAVLAAQFTALDRLAPGRVIAGLGTGDRLSEEENLAYGIPFAPGGRAARRDGRAGPRRWSAPGCPVWVAGGPAGRTEEARAAGAALNVWDADPRSVASGRGGPEAVEVTWAGPPPAGHAARGRATAGACAAPEPAGPCSAGRSTSRSWPLRRARGDAGGVQVRGTGPGRRLPRWSSAASTGCRPMSSPPSTI